MIEVSNVSLSLGGNAILRDVSITLPRGGITALIGPNGAGKSSLLCLIARLRQLQSGRISVDGLPVDSTPGPQLAKVMAILRQETGEPARLRVEEFVGFGRFPHSRGRLTPVDRQIIRETLEQFELADLSDRFLDTLSGGQRQRAWVAMVFCQGADYVLLDEPLNNLDMFQARKLMQTLRRVAMEDGRTIVIVLHDINHAAAYADRVVAMKDGQVQAFGAAADVIQPAILERVFGYRMQVIEIDGRAIVLHHV